MASRYAVTAGILCRHLLDGQGVGLLAAAARLPTLVSVFSEAFTLEAGDVIVTGTPSGVGLVRKPPLWMKPGDVCEVELEDLGVLRNPTVDQAAARAEAAE